MDTFLIILLVVVAVITVVGHYNKSVAANINELDEQEWEFGSDWKQDALQTAVSDNDVEYVEVLRGDTGNGYDDSYMIDLIGYLGSRGIIATYDSFSLGLEPAAIKTYVLKVELGKEAEAIGYLREKESGEK
ncbi:MAG TPA: hypothetical protein VLX29_01170 [Nitrospirota bacterium]|nr:hypothetical protein [Nitrospirota bacterium]